MGRSSFPILLVQHQVLWVRFDAAVTQEIIFPKHMVDNTETSRRCALPRWREGGWLYEGEGVIGAE